jgi:hypothetical protein
MKGMPGLPYAEGMGEGHRLVGSVLYMSGDTAEVRRRYRREDAEPLPRDAGGTGPRRAGRGRQVLLAVAVVVGALAVGSVTVVSLFPTEASVTHAAGAAATRNTMKNALRLETVPRPAGAGAGSGPLGR